MISYKKKQIGADLTILLSIITTLIIIGLLFIYSASSVFALEKCGSSLYFVKKQLIGLMLGMLGLTIARFIPLEIIKRMAPFLFLSSLTLTGLTFLPHFAIHIHGSSRWIKIMGIAFQPSELLKIAFVIYVAYLLAKPKKIPSFGHNYLPLLIVLAMTCIVLLKQPDFGMTVTIALTFFILLFIAQLPGKQLMLTCLCALPIVMGLIWLKPYRLKRIMTFLNPWDDPQGTGFQIIQSLIAIGSGSLTGVGVSNSRQKFFYLPMQHTDFIFSIIAEETGFIGSSILILLFVGFLYFGIRIAGQLKDPFAMFASLGFIIMTSLQALINIFVATGLLPTKGIGLPFVSYGNTSLVCSLIMVGLVMNCVQDNRG